MPMFVSFFLSHLQNLQRFLEENFPLVSREVYVTQKIVTSQEIKMSAPPCMCKLKRVVICYCDCNKIRDG